MMGCDGVDSDCDGVVDECDEDLIPPTISFKDGLAIDAVTNRDGVTAIASPAFRSIQEAKDYLESIIEAEDDCASELDIAVNSPLSGVQCESTEFKVIVTHSRCSVSVERRFMMVVDPYVPVVSIAFDNSTVENDDHYDANDGRFLHIVSFFLPEPPFSIFMVHLFSLACIQYN